MQLPHHPHQKQQRSSLWGQTFQCWDRENSLSDIVNSLSILSILINLCILSTLSNLSILNALSILSILSNLSILNNLSILSILSTLSTQILEMHGKLQKMCLPALTPAAFPRSDLG